MKHTKTKWVSVVLAVAMVLSMVTLPVAADGEASSTSLPAVTTTEAAGDTTEAASSSETTPTEAASSSETTPTEAASSSETTPTEAASSSDTTATEAASSTETTPTETASSSETTTETTPAPVMGQANGVMTVAEGEEKTVSGDVCQIGETKYATLAEAIAAAQDGDTIEVFATGKETGVYVSLDKDLTIQMDADYILEADDTTEKFANEAAFHYAGNVSLTFSGSGIMTLENYYHGIYDGSENTGVSYGGSLNVTDSATLNVVGSASDGIQVTPKDGNGFTINIDKQATLCCDGNAGSGIGTYGTDKTVSLTINVDGNGQLISKNSTGSGGNGIYTESSAAKLNINVTGGTVRLENVYNGITGHSGSKVNLSKGATFIATNTWHAGANLVDFTVDGSTLHADENEGWGLCFVRLDIKNYSKVTTNKNGLSGIVTQYANNKLTVDGTSSLHINENCTAYSSDAIASSASSSGLHISSYTQYSSSYANSGVVEIAAGADFEVKDNAFRGINATCGTVDIQSGVISGNGSKGATYGGGVYVEAFADTIDVEVTLGSGVQVYNNAATIAGDDLYNKNGTLMFSNAQSDDGLVLTVRCDNNDVIDGWYDDSEGNRWKAHGTSPFHTVEYRNYGEATTAALALKAAHTLLAPDPDDPATTEWDTSKSKTATNLDENYESQVTLSLPAAEEVLVSDVVFVMDESSCTEEVKAQVAELLADLYAQIDETNAAIKIGAVQFRGNVTTLPLTTLTADTKDTVTKFMSERPGVGGSNLHAGLLAGEKMLDEDTEVDASRKYLILVSDGIAYIWDEDGTNIGINFANADAPNTPMLASPDGWGVKYGNGYTPANWTTHFAEVSPLIDETIADKASEYDRNDPTNGKPFVANGEKDDYASTVDIALYKANEVYQEISSKYHTYAVMAGEADQIEIHPYGPSFMNYLAGGEKVTFDSIQREVFYLLDAGSVVVDEIGYGTDDQNCAYAFDFVADTSKLTLKVGDDVYQASAVSENVYSFDNGNYVLTYYPQGTTYGGRTYQECFVWEINVPVSNFAPVQLIYSVKLTDPQTTKQVADVTHGQYDADGSKNYTTGLYTNHEAILYPVDSNGGQGLPEYFAQPTVSYTVKGTGTPAPSVSPAPSPSVSPAPTAAPTPSTGNTSYTSSAPQTGDSGIPLFALVLLLLAGAGVLSFVVWRRSRKGE